MSFHLLSASSPCASSTAAATVGSRIFVHGGLTQPKSTDPTSALHCFDTGSEKWLSIPGRNSPALSHHRAFVQEDRFLNLVGGWEGKQRCATVSVFDTRQEQWILVGAPIHDFPTGGGEFFRLTKCRTIVMKIDS